MPDQKGLSKLTRSLLIGSSAGAIALQVGCVPVVYEDAQNTQAGTTRAAGPALPVIRVANPVEGQLCNRAYASRSAGDATQLMLQFPSSTCIAPLLNVMSPNALAAIPAQAVQGLSPSVLGQLSPSTRNILANQVVPQVAAPAQTNANAVANQVLDTREGRLTTPRY